MTKNDISISDFSRNRVCYNLTLHDFMLGHLVRLYSRFHGDLVSAIVLGAISQHTISHAAKVLDFDLKKITEVLAKQDKAYILPCNAYSISQSTGIPRQTVKRKIERLVREGYLHMSDNGDLYLTNEPGNVFEEFCYSTVNDFLHTAEKLKRCRNK